jgi:hypothetical protein
VERDPPETPSPAGCAVGWLVRRAVGRGSPPTAASWPPPPPAGWSCGTWPARPVPPASPPWPDRATTSRRSRSPLAEPAGRRDLPRQRAGVPRGRPWPPGPSRHPPGHPGQRAIPRRRKRPGRPLRRRLRRRRRLRGRLQPGRACPDGRDHRPRGAARHGGPATRSSPGRWTARVPSATSPPSSAMSATPSRPWPRATASWPTAPSQAARYTCGPCTDPPRDRHLPHPRPDHRAKELSPPDQHQAAAGGPMMPQTAWPASAPAR